MTHGETIAFWVWLVPAVVIAIGGQFVITWASYKEAKSPMEEDRGICALVGITWPVLLVCISGYLIVTAVFRFIFHGGPILLFKKIDQWRTQTHPHPPAPARTEETPYRSPAPVCPGCGRPLPDEKP